METKVCTKCEEKKCINEFSFKNKDKDIRRGQCKTCVKEYRKGYYINNRNKLLKYSVESSKKIKLRNQQYIWDYLKNNSCLDCGEKNPIVLEFDHREGENKIIEVTTAARDGWSLKNLQKEIDKCDVRCANCHRIKTFHQFNWLSKIIK